MCPNSAIVSRVKGSCNYKEAPRFCSFHWSSLPDPHMLNISVPSSGSLTLGLEADRHTSCLFHHNTRRPVCFSSSHGPAPSLLIEEPCLAWTLVQPQLQHHSISVPISVASTWWHWHTFCPLCLILFGLVCRNDIASVLFRSVSRIIIGSVRRLTSPLQQGWCPQYQFSSGCW